MFLLCRVCDPKARATQVRHGAGQRRPRALRGSVIAWAGCSAAGALQHQPVCVFTAFWMSVGFWPKRGSICPGLPPAWFGGLPDFDDQPRFFGGSGWDLCSCAGNAGLSKLVLVVCEPICHTRFPGRRLLCGVLLQSSSCHQATVKYIHQPCFSSLKHRPWYMVPHHSMLVPWSEPAQ